MKYRNYNLINRINKIVELKYSMSQFLSFVLIMVCFDAIAQEDYSANRMAANSSNDQFYKVVSFGDKIDFGNIENTAKWTIVNTKEGIFVTLSGSQINEYTFEKPGFYEISFLENKKRTEECNHPQFNEKMKVKVSPIKMVFDFSKIDFSEKIQKGRNCENIIITVPVNITTKDNSSERLDAPGLSIAGIGVSLSAKPINQQIVAKNGIQFLKYQLSGFVNNETYLMFDFSDFNNQVQTYNHLQIIN